VAEESARPSVASRKRELRLIALAGVPLVREGDDLGDIVVDALARSDEKIVSGDVLVLAQKVVSKAARLISNQ
jgi:coenzyme F420-0:L-glutamate ligase/coenzyme F420-1:gamma-L-glutamate ligase